MTVVPVHNSMILCLMMEEGAGRSSVGPLAGDNCAHFPVRLICGAGIGHWHFAQCFALLQVPS
jgi:hypothetical protein